jgi:SAM-dependent methyltransferase
MCSLSPTALLDVVLDELRPASVLDVGCGTGQSMAYLAARGVGVLGVEGSALAISRGTMPDVMRRVDLRRPLDLGRRFDVVWTYEVAEHIHPRYTGIFVDTLARHGDRVVMSAARPGQGGEGHFNEQPPEYWIARLERRGFTLDRRLTERLRSTPDEFAANMLAFHRRGTPPSDGGP